MLLHPRRTRVDMLSWTLHPLGKDECHDTRETQEAPGVPVEFRTRLLELLGGARSPDEVSQQFVPSSQTIRDWVHRAERGRAWCSDGLTSAEREAPVVLLNDKCTRASRDSRAASWRQWSFTHEGALEVRFRFLTCGERASRPISTGRCRPDRVRYGRMMLTSDSRATAADRARLDRLKAHVLAMTVRLEKRIGYLLLVVGAWRGLAATWSTPAAMVTGALGARPGTTAPVYAATLSVHRCPANGAGLRPCSLRRPPAAENERMVLTQGVRQSRSLPLERDSAGVRIVENGLRASAPTHLLGSLVFQVGGLEVDPKSEFNHAAGFLIGVPLLRGGLAVIDVDRIHFFDSKFQRTRIVGRRGAGPSEFRYLTALCRAAGDTLVVHDAHNRRMAVVAASGVVVRTFGLGQMNPFPAHFCTGDGRLVLWQSLPTTRSGDRRIQLVTVRLDGTLFGRFGDLMVRPLDMVTQVVPHVATFGSTIYFGDGARGDVLAFSQSGELTKIIRIGDPRSVVTEAEIEMYLRAASAGRYAAGSLKGAREALRARVPEVWPAFRRIDVDADGNLWMQDARSPRGKDIWTAFDTAGHMRARLVIEFPADRTRSFEVLSFGRGEVFVRRYGNDGAAYVAAYRVPPLRASGR